MDKLLRSPALYAFAIAAVLAIWGYTDLRKRVESAGENSQTSLARERSRSEQRCELLSWRIEEVERKIETLSAEPQRLREMVVNAEHRSSDAVDELEKKISRMRLEIDLLSSAVNRLKR